MRKRILLLITTLMLGITVFAGNTAAGSVESEFSSDALLEEAVQKDLITVEVSLSEEGEIVIGDYSNIEIPFYLIEVPDADVESKIQDFLYSETKEDGDEALQIPDLTDEYVKEYSLQYLGKQVNTIHELRQEIYSELYNRKLYSAVMKTLSDNAEVISYPKEQFELVRSYVEKELVYEVQFYVMYGIEDADEEAVARMYGYSSAKDLLDDQTMKYMNDIMLLDKIAADLGITYTEEEVDEVIGKLVDYNHLSESYTVDSIKEENGEAWVFLMGKLNVEYNKVLQELINNVYIRDSYEDYGSFDPEDYDFSSLASFTAQILGEGVFTEENLAEKDLTMIYVWSTTCGYCVEEMPELAELATALPDNVQLITYCTDGSIYPDTAQKILEESGLKVVTVTEGDGDFRKLDLKLMYTPTMLIFDSTGQVTTDAVIGAGNLTERYTNALNNALEQIGS